MKWGKARSREVVKYKCIRPRASMLVNVCRSSAFLTTEALFVCCRIQGEFSNAGATDRVAVLFGIQGEFSDTGASDRVAVSWSKMAPARVPLRNKHFDFSPVLDDCSIHGAIFDAQRPPSQHPSIQSKQEAPEPSQ
ncbi:uncharacterized protein ACBT44_003727 isoform 1-T1 [Syngnathus typhle]